MRFWSLKAALPLAPGGMLGLEIGRLVDSVPRLHRRHPGAAGAVAGRSDAVPRHFLARVSPNASARCWKRAWFGSIAPLGALAGSSLRPRRGREARGRGRGRAPQDRRDHAAGPHRAGRTGDSAGAARPRRASRRSGRRRCSSTRPGERAAAAASARRAVAQAGRPAGRRNAGIHLAPDRAQARRLRRRGQGAVRPPRPGGDALRDRAGHRRQGRDDRRSGQGSGARAVAGQHPRRRDRARQVLHGAGTAQSAPADGAPVGDHRLQGLPRHAFAADHRPGQGHRRRAGGRRPGQDAAPAGGRHHRLRQVGRHQRHDPVAALQVRAARRAPDHGRPEDAGAVDLRRHPAPAGAGGHRHEQGRQRAALVRRRNGAPLQADVGAGRAQPRRLQQQDPRCREGRRATWPIPSRWCPNRPSR